MSARTCCAVASMLALAISVWAAGTALAHPAQRRHRHTSCHAGTTAFHRGAVRAFIVSSTDPQTGGPDERLLLCTHGSRIPRLMIDGGGDATLGAIRFELEGSRLAFAIEIASGLSSVAPVDVGWIGLHAGTARTGPLGAGYDPNFLVPEQPLLPFDRVNLMVAPDGWMAVISATKSGCQVVSVLAARARASTSGYLLEVPYVLFTAPKGGLDAASLRIDDTTVSWTNTSGVPASSVRSTGTPATGTLSAQTGGC